MAARSRSLATIPASRGAARLVLRQLAATRKAADRFGMDAEAVHDFRVALRRLRVLLKFYAEPLDFLKPRKAARRARKLAKATATARDAEVQLAWLARFERGLAGPGTTAWRAWLEAGAGGAADLEAARESFGRLEASLRAAIRKAEAGGGELVRDEPAFGTVAAASIREAATKLAAALEAISGPADDERLHAARIAGKRLRYLLESVRDRSPAARKIVARLKKLQDRLGELHDLAVFLASLEAFAGRVPGSALGKVAERAGKRKEDAFAGFREAWPAGGTADGLVGAESVARSLARTGSRRS